MQNKQGGMENNFTMHRRLGEWEVRHHGRCQQPARQCPARPPRGARGKAPPFIRTAKRTHSQVLDTIVGTAQIVGTRAHFARCVLSHVTFTSLSAATVAMAPPVQVVPILTELLTEPPFDSNPADCHPFRCEGSFTTIRQPGWDVRGRAAPRGHVSRAEPMNLDG